MSWSACISISSGVAVLAQIYVLVESLSNAILLFWKSNTLPEVALPNFRVE